MNAERLYNGEIEWVEGFEFVVSEVSYKPHATRPAIEIRTFTGRCTENPVNDDIRHLGYNGGRYGRAVLASPWEFYKTARVRSTGEFVRLLRTVRDCNGSLTAYETETADRVATVVPVGDLDSFCL